MLAIVSIPAAVTAHIKQLPTELQQQIQALTGPRPGRFTLTLVSTWLQILAAIALARQEGLNGLLAHAACLRDLMFHEREKYRPLISQQGEWTVLRYEALQLMTGRCCGGGRWSLWGTWGTTNGLQKRRIFDCRLARLPEPQRILEGC